MIRITAELLPFDMGAFVELISLGWVLSQSLCLLARVQVSLADAFWHGLGQLSSQKMTIFRVLCHTGGSELDQERSRLARSHQHKTKLAAEEERFHDITVDNNSFFVFDSVHASQPSPHDNAVPVAASASAVPATPAGSGDCAALGAANTI